MVPRLRTIDDLLKEEADASGSLRALVRADFNVPMQHGKVRDASRIIRTIPTIKKLLKNNCKVIIISHFGRPGGSYDPSLSLAPIADTLAELIEKPVKFGVDCVGTAAKEAADKLEAGEILLLENLRFHAGERANNSEFVRQLVDIADIYINDAFSCSHRAHASIYGVTEFLPSAAGELLASEIKSLQSALETPEKPVIGFVAGSKVSSKIDMLNNLVQKLDYLAIGGGMANTFIHALGKNVGKSLCEKDLSKIAKEIIKTAKRHNCEILLPTDAVVAESLEANPICEIVSIDNIPSDKMILDVGPETIQNWTGIIQDCKTLLWNGPLGAFEYSPFDVASVSIARIIALQTARDKLISIAGGGDVVAALSHAGLNDSFSYISTAGGAFMEWLEGNELPGITALQNG